MNTQEASASSLPAGLTLVGGVRSGRDPRDMARNELIQTGHLGTGRTETSPIKAIRAKCVDCCAGQLAEVRNCTATECPLWAFRMGVNPFYGKPA